MKVRSWNQMAVVGLAALGLSAAIAGYPGGAQATTDTTPTGSIAPTQVDLPPVPAEVLHMFQAGMSDDVVTSYIQKSVSPYTLDASQIIYLHDLGVSSEVLNALVNHGATAANGPAAVANESTDEANASSSETPPVNGAATDFYHSLAPYGTWVYVSGYGWCWQPTVVVVNSSWQPYCNNGCWLWSDQGWYWNSYYSWGWAPFHYGRWCQSASYGWLWCPDHTWGPAWVCWRGYPGYCGWAPLPPGACFTTGGWCFHGVAVGFNFGFGLNSHCFTFCDFNHFCQPHPFDHFQHGHDADHFFHGSQVNNNVAFDAQHRFVNRGVDPSHIEAATHSHLQPVAVREMPNQAGHSGNSTMPDRLTRNGDARMIYRPGQNISGMQNSFPRTPHVPSVNHGSGYSMTRGDTLPHQGSTAPQFQPGRQNNFRPPMPGASWNHWNQNLPSRQWGSAGNSQMRNFPPPQNFHRDYADSQRFTPMGHPAPVWHPAPAWNSPPTGHAAPSRSWGGGGYASGGGHGGGGSRASGGFHR